MSNREQNAKISLCITSCGRADLLAKTLDSFMPHHAHHFSQMLVIDDAGSKTVKDWVEAHYPDVEIVLNETQMGQMRSIDKLYALVENDYIFHGEDDWLFEPVDTVDACLAVMEAEPDVSVVCVRKLSDLQEKFQKHSVKKVVNDVHYALMPLDIHPEWLSFTFNPGLVKKSVWATYGPYQQHVTEERISMVMKKDGWKVAFLDPGACHHIGDGQHVDDPEQPIRAKTFPQRMKRSVLKRVRRLRRRLGHDV